MIKYLILILFPLASLADSHIPYYKSLSKNESWLRHYPDIQDFKEQTEKFFLTQKGMAVKVIEEHQSIGSKYIDWYRIELFNGIQGWIYHTQLTRKRSLLILKDTELYALKSTNPNSLFTIQKGEILSPKIVNAQTNLALTLFIFQFLSFLSNSRKTLSIALLKSPSLPPHLAE